MANPSDRLIELMADFEAAREAGRPMTPEEACAADPELLAAFRELAGQLRSIDRFLDTSETAENPPAAEPAAIPPLPPGIRRPHRPAADYRRR